MDLVGEIERCCVGAKLDDVALRADRVDAVFSALADPSRRFVLETLAYVWKRGALDWNVKRRARYLVEEEVA